jgi:hypothetical protein
LLRIDDELKSLDMRVGSNYIKRYEFALSVPIQFTILSTSLTTLLLATLASTSPVDVDLLGIEDDASVTPDEGHYRSSNPHYALEHALVYLNYPNGYKYPLKVKLDDTAHAGFQPMSGGSAAIGSATKPELVGRIECEAYANEEGTEQVGEDFKGDSDAVFSAEDGKPVKSIRCSVQDVSDFSL